MDKIYIAMDGDNAGSLVGQSVLNNDPQRLRHISDRIKFGISKLVEYISSIGGDIISYGGDELVAILDQSQQLEIEKIRSMWQDYTGFTATIGVGSNLSQAGKALIAGKLSGKDQVFNYDKSVDSILIEAHKASTAGTATEEQQKMSDHYLDATTEDDEQQMSDSDQEMSDSDQEKIYGENFSQDQEMSEDEEEPLNFRLHGEDYEDEHDGEPEESFDEDMPEQDEDSDYIIDEYDHEDEEGEENPEIEEDYGNRQKEFIYPEIMEDLNLRKENEEDESLHEKIVLPEEIDEMDLPTSDQVNPQGESMAEVNNEQSEDDLNALESELAGVSSNEEILQRIAQNLKMFKENKELLEKIKKSNPQLYASILELLHNMIELASIIDPDIRPEKNTGDVEDEETPEVIQNIDNWEIDQKKKPFAENFSFPKKVD